MESRYNYRKGYKSHLRLSARRKNPIRNLLKYNAARRADLPCLTKDVVEGWQRETSTIIEPVLINLPKHDNVETMVEGYTENMETLDIENEQNDSHISKQKREITIDGARIVYIQPFLEALKLLPNHSPFGCTLFNMKIVKEVRHGLQSKFTFKCDMCYFEKTISTCPESPEKLDINSAAITAVMNVGSGYTQFKSISAGMDIPSFGFTLYKTLHSNICKSWEEVAWKSMKEAAGEEAKLAIECGNVNTNGIPMITVVCDGSWAKRSYRGGGNYNSLSGTAAIIGVNTGKILYLGVKNKYCCVCQRAQNRGEIPGEHTCYKNWSSSSTSMEAAIISEGFCRSIEMYNLIYNKMIADGDSSCYKKILDSKPYDDCTVQKIECINHLLRNYSNKLKELAKIRGVPGAIKNVINKNILRCRTAVIKAIKYRKSEKDKSEEEKIKCLRQDVLNSVSHIFGEHKNCSKSKYFCSLTGPDKNNYMEDFKSFAIEEKLMNAVRYLASHSKSLLENKTTNIVEQFNSVIAQKVGGKRINYCMKNGYQARCFSAVVAKNTKRPIYQIHKHLTGYSPSNLVKQNEARKLLKVDARVKRKLKFSNAQGPDSHYGDNAQKPDLPMDLYKEKEKDFLGKLDKTEGELTEIERRTRLQADSAEWREQRRKILTASFFGKVCKMRPSTSCSSTVISILYKEFSTKATEWGRNNEDRAKRLLESKFGFDISDCGIYINKKWPYLGSSPDGLEKNSDCLVEIKCPYSARDFTISEAICKKYILFLKVDDEGAYSLKKSDNYYYQVQGQLNIAGKQKCYFCVWTLKEIIYLEILVDKDFFNDTMLPKLYRFYMNCLLPEIVDSRHTRGMEIRDPLYITDAQVKKPNSKNKKRNDDDAMTSS